MSLKKLLSEKVMSTEDLKLQSAIMQLVQVHLASKANFTEFRVETNLVDAGLSSFDMVQIVLGIENKFCLKFPDEELSPSNFESIASIARITRELLMRS